MRRDRKTAAGSALKRLAVAICLGACVPASGGIHETIPLWHWAYRIIDELRMRGGFDSLGMMEKPFTRGDVARALVSLRSAAAGGRVRLDAVDMQMVSLLEREFRSEMEAVRHPEGKTELPQAGVRIRNDVDGASEEPAKNRVAFRSRLNVPIGRNASLISGMAFDQALLDDPLYTGKKWRGLGFVTEQACLAFEGGPVLFRFGRDYLSWGAGRSGSLLFSGAGRPMDLAAGRIAVGPFHYDFVHASLDSRSLSIGVRDSLGTGTIRRYVSSHRLSARLLRNRMQCALTEAILYGGLNRPVEWKYRNPFVVYHAESANDQDVANSFGMADVTVWPADGLEMHGSLLIDDVQVEKTGPGDLEPDEIGWLAGVRIGSPVLSSATTLSFEYVRVTNRTYKTPNPRETFIHRGVPLGHPLGNDFDRLDIGISRWITGSIRVELTWSQTRKGEGSLYTPFDEPWLAYTVEQGYHESFPTGVVEKRDELGYRCGSFRAFTAGWTPRFGPGRSGTQDMRPA
jgi:hypothetical protein